MTDFEKITRNVEYKFKRGLIKAYFICPTFSKTRAMIETVNNRDKVLWQYFDKTTGKLLEKP